MSYLDMPGHLIRRLSQHSSHVFQEEMKRQGWDITSVQFAAMQAIDAEQQIEQAQIAALISYDKATIGGVVDRLEKKGWVMRTASPTDRRAKLVSLTEEGRGVLQQTLPVVQSLQQTILQGLSEQQKNDFITLASKVLGQ